MSFLRLLIRDLKWHAKSFILLSLAACLVCMVLTSALLIGDSVRGTLRDQIALGTSSVKTRLIFSTPIVAQMPGSVLHTSGFISAKIKADLYAFPHEKTISGRDAYCSEALAKALNLKQGESFTVRVLTMAPINSEQLMGMPPELRQIRLVFKGVWQDDRAEVNLTNPQKRPLNLFISHDLLTETLTLQKHAVNEVWHEADTQEAVADLPDSVYWRLSQLKFDRWQNRPILKCDAYYIPPAVAQACPNASKGLITFAKSLSDSPDNQMHYFFVGAFEGDLLPVKPNTLRISKHVARQFKQPVSLTCYVMDAYRQINTQSHTFASISTVTDSMMSSIISPDVPGLTDSEDCTQWMTGMPIDLQMVDQSDKDYWNAYQSKPKVYMNFEQAQHIFAPGQCTLLVFDSGTNQESIKNQIIPVLRNDPRWVQSLSVANLQNANLQDGVQFAPLFLGLSLFIIISGLLILWMLLKLHIQSRHDERQILSTYVGSDGQIRRFLTSEIMLAIIPGILMGLLAGVVLCRIQLLLLEHLWNEIIGMDALNLHASWQSFAIALVSTTVSCWLLLMVSLRVPARKPRFYLPKSQPISSARALGTLSFIRRFRQYRVCTVLLILGILGTLGVGGFGIKVRGEDGFSYGYVAQTAVPVVPSYDAPFPPGGLAVRVYQADRADCANLLRASLPTVYGCDTHALTGDPTYLQRSDAAADAGSLQWIIKRQIGDHLCYPNGQVTLQRAMKASVFQRGILVNEDTFETLFPDIQGAEFFLIKDQQSASAYRSYLEPYGLTLMSVDQFMSEAETIQNRYLAIFLQLGLLGFILGIGSMVLMVLHQLNAQRHEMALMYQLGLAKRMVKWMFFVENLLIYVIASVIALILLLVLVVVCEINLPVVVIGWISLFVIGVLLIGMTIKYDFHKHDRQHAA